MIDWLDLGSDFRQFATSDVEGELNAQATGAQLLSIICKEPLQIEAGTIPD